MSFCTSCGTALTSNASFCHRCGRSATEVVAAHAPVVPVEEAVRCPKCGSSQIHAERRGWRASTGFIGSSKIILTCLRCGHRSRPGDWQLFANVANQSGTTLSPTSVAQSTPQLPGKWGRDRQVALIILAVVALLCIALAVALQTEDQSNAGGQAANAAAGTATNTNSSSSGQAVVERIPPPKFRVFRSMTDQPTSYVVPVSTTDEQLKSLLWYFRIKVRAADFRAIGITRPTAKQWGRNGYSSGMLVVYRNAKCVSEAYEATGKLGPCGYGEHDDAYYQWGVSGDPYKDEGGLTDKNGNATVVFDFKDNWHAPVEKLQ